MAKLSIRDQVSQRTGTEDSREISVCIKDIPLGEIVIKENIRTEYSEIEALQKSIQLYGLLQPITVYRDGDRYAVKTGHRRFLAYQKLYQEKPEQFHHIRCIISNDAHIQIIQLIENVQRSDLSQKELYDALKSLREIGYTHKQIAECMGKSEGYITNLFVAINEIASNDHLQKALGNAGVTLMDIKETKGITDEQTRLSLLKRRKNGTINRAELRKEIKTIKKTNQNSHPPSMMQIVYNEQDRTITITLPDEPIPINDIIKDMKNLLQRYTEK